ncbi:MAG: DUF192 domain-containing protein [Acidimicrobiia bacterium]
MALGVAACSGEPVGEVLAKATATVGDDELRVWVADEAEERAQGLRGVERLPSGLDGMLFVFATPTSAVFVMEDTLMPLDVWFFDEEGLLVGSHEMTPCSRQPCVRYPTPGPVAWAMETPLGERDFQPGMQLTTSASS